MSVKLLVLYPTPTDPEQFDRQYEREHLPMGKAALVGATGLATHRILGSPAGKSPFRSPDGGHVSLPQGHPGVRGPARRPEDAGQRGRNLDRRGSSLHDRGAGRLSSTSRSTGAGAFPGPGHLSAAGLTGVDSTDLTS